MEMFVKLRNMYTDTSSTVSPEIFARILFSQIALKCIFASLKSLLGPDSPISVKDRVILAFGEDFIFKKTAKFREYKTLTKISEFTVSKISPMSERQ